MKLLDAALSRFRRLTTGGMVQPDLVPPSEAEYYEDLFVRNPDWNKTTPNVDESSRWERIKGFLDRYFESHPDKEILDAGCGRGWLTNLLSAYGTAMGIEPVVPVVEHARLLFPDLKFEATTPADLDTEGRYDAIVSSEVLEHVVDKSAFVRRLHELLKPGGILVVTTPRGELYEEWVAKFSKPSQPIEQWITTEALLTLLRSTGFDVLDSTTAFALGIYQIHVCRRLAGKA